MLLETIVSYSNQRDNILKNYLHVLFKNRQRSSTSFLMIASTPDQIMVTTLSQIRQVPCPIKILYTLRGPMDVSEKSKTKTLGAGKTWKQKGLVLLPFRELY